MNDPRPTTDLGDMAAWPFEDDASEVILRVASYQQGTFQAIVKHRDASRPWGVGVNTNPVLALDSAISAFYAHAPEPSALDAEIEDLLA